MPGYSAVLRELLNVVPSATFLAGFTLFALLLSLAIFGLMRRHLPHFTRGDDNELGGITIGVVGGLYGFTLAFVIVTLWVGFDRAQSVVSTEASGLATVVRDASSFPPGPRAAILTAVSAYLHSVRTDEWDAMRHGGYSTQSLAAFDEIYHQLSVYQPSDPSAVAFYADAVGRLSEANQARRERIDIAKTTIPGALFFLIFAGAGVVASLMSVMGTQNSRIQVVMLFAITSFVAFNLALAVLLDYPYSGDLAVSSQPFASGVLAQFFR